LRGFIRKYCLQFVIPGEAEVIKRPSVIEEVGTLGLSGQRARREMIALRRRRSLKNFFMCEGNEIFSN